MTRPRLSPNAVAVLVMAALGVAVLLWQRPWQSDEPARTAAVADAAAALTNQFADLSSATTEQELARAAGSGPAAQDFAVEAWSAREALGVDGADLRYISGGDRAVFDNGDTRARVEVATPGVDDPADVQVRLRPQQDGTFDVVSVAVGTGQLPLWLAGEVRIERSGDVKVVRVGGGDPDLDVERLATTARTRVAASVPGTGGSLTVVSAPSPQTAGALLGQDTEAVRQIAAVSTRFDARNGDLAGPAVVLNPGVFDSMDARAAQIVMTHEATHVLTGAIGSSAPTWVIEGFADFVALRDDDAPLSTSAGQVLRQVAAAGAPEALPTTADFDGSAYGLGASYESAWLAFRMLGAQFDDAEVITFYRAVLRGSDVDTAGEKAFDLDTAQITSRWRDYLTKSASTVS